MTGRDLIPDDDLQAYLDDRLELSARAVIRARLRTCPTLRWRVETMRRQHEALRQIGREILAEPVPAHLRRILRRAPAAPDGGAGDPPAWRRRAPHLTTAAAAILIGCIGNFAL